MPNASQELLQWLQSLKIRHNLFAVPPVVINERKDRKSKPKQTPECPNHEIVSDSEVTRKLKQKLEKQDL